MSASGHPFSSSAALTNVTRLLSTGDTTALNWILCSCALTVGATPSATSTNGFSATVTRNGATSDYTLTFANAFNAVPMVWASPIKADSHIFYTIYSVTVNAVRVRFYDAGGNLVDPDSAQVMALGV